MQILRETDVAHRHWLSVIDITSGPGTPERVLSRRVAGPPTHVADDLLVAQRSLDVGGGRQGPALGGDKDLPHTAIRDADRGRLPARPLFGGAALVAPPPHAQRSAH